MQKKRILIVDDEDAFGKMVKINLEETGNFEVRFETRGSQSVEAARSFKPDLILMDIMMRDMAGPQAARKIQEEEDLKSIPIVFLTAVVKKEGEKNASIGGLPVLSKPIQTEDLVKFLDEKLG